MGEDWVSFDCRVAFRLAVTMPLLWLLAACWASEHPLIDGAHAARPPIEGTYRSADPKERDAGTMRITAGSDGGFVLDDGVDKQRLYLAQLREGWFLVQWQKLETNASRVGGACLYSLMRIAADSLVVHGSPCDAGFDGIAGIKREGSTCTFATLAAARRAALEALRRIDAGEPAEEPAVLVRDAVGRGA
jgi:hypothetical protein